MTREDYFMARKQVDSKLSGRRKTEKMEIAIEPHIKAEFMRLLEEEGRVASVEIRTWIREYINKRKR